MAAGAGYLRRRIEHPAEMTEYRYPTNRILADFVLGGGGIVMSAGLMALASPSVYILAIFGALTAVFLLFTMRTVIRHRLRIAADADGLKLNGGLVRALKWQELDGLSLRYYSTRRNRKDGWMTLGLKSRGRSLSIDSHIEGFETLARMAADAAVARGLPLDTTTRSNFAAMEVALPPAVGESARS